MTPKQFVLLAIAAVASTLLALTTYALDNRWSQGEVAGAPLFSSLAAASGRVGAIEIKQGTSALTLERKGEAWGIKERAGYSADTDKVRALVLRLSQADLMEPKTSKPDRYALLELEDPAGKDAKSKLIRAIDTKGYVIAEVVTGKRRADAFGAGKGGTYVRKPGDPQTWLASGDIDAPTAVRDWIRPQVFDADSSKISKLTVEIDGEEPLKVERAGDKDGKDVKVAFVGLPPEGKKLKDTYAADTLLRAASAIEIDDVRKAVPPAGKPGKVSFETSDGLKVAFSLLKAEDANYWLGITVAGEGDAKKQADEIGARVHGWEFKVSPGKAESLLKRRADLIDEKGS
jgi:hypothetical protein